MKLFAAILALTLTPSLADAAYIYSSLTVYVPAVGTVNNENYFAAAFTNLADGEKNYQYSYAGVAGAYSATGPDVMGNRATAGSSISNPYDNSLYTLQAALIGGLDTYGWTYSDVGFNYTAGTIFHIEALATYLTTPLYASNPKFHYVEPQLYSNSQITLLTPDGLLTSELKNSSNNNGSKLLELNYSSDKDSILYFHSYTYSGVGPVAAVPEPSTYAMLLAGLGLIGFSYRRKVLINRSMCN